MMITKKVTKMQFGLFSPTDVLNLSVVHVIFPETLEAGLPKPNGLADTRMGTTESSYACDTCGGDSFNCAGHFGHIELCRPVFHPGYVARVKKILDTICFYCSRIRRGEKRNDSKPINSQSISVCSFCNNKQPLIKKEGLVLFAYMKGEDSEGKVMLNGERVLGIFKKISDEDISALGLNPVYSRPENMLIKILLVAPPCVRPSVIVEGMSRSEDDLTYKYCDIIKSNANLRRYEEEGAPAHIIRDYEHLVQYHVATLIDNDMAGQPQSLQRNGRPLKAISARLRGKEGRLRGNLMGKRVDFSARSVISPDPNIELDQLGVPQTIASTHTIPERVTEFNRSRLQALVDSGPFKHPGANYVVRSDGQRIDLRYTKSLILENGFIVERHLSNNDCVLFNRQPSLHKMSMMSHNVRVMPGLTFRLNLSATTPYGADFDGDEMNMHTPQTYNAHSELKNLMTVSKCMLSAQANKPIMGIVQDTCIGSYVITNNEVLISEGDALNLCYSADVTNSGVYEKPAILRPVRLYTGKQLFSYVLPKINFARQGFLIRHGNLITGTADKKNLGTSGGSLVHVITSEFGPTGISKFINGLQKLISCFLCIHGFSVGVGDTIFETDNSPIYEAIESIKTVKAERIPGFNMRQSYESKVSMVLNTARDMKTNSYSSNNLIKMIKSGSKGSQINISQVTYCVGQQNVEGGRISFGFRNRSLPHFTKYDHGALARGFVPSSYIKGLSPSSFFFHTMGGREGLIDTACKTAETGYIQRRIVKALEDARIEYDGSVRGSNTVYQFIYGNDLFDAAYLENNSIKYDFMKLAELKVGRNLIVENDGKTILKVSSALNELLKDKGVKAVLDEEYELLTRIKSKTLLLPFNIDRILDSCRGKVADFDPRVLFKKRNELILNLSLCHPHTRRLGLFPSVLEGILLTINTRAFINFSLGADKIDLIVKKVHELYLRSLVPTNEMVGTLAAQSIGEPATQMTLNTFHFAGVAQHISTGVPRLKEIINAAKNIRNPFQVVKTTFEDIEDARALASEIEYQVLSSVIDYVSIIYDPIPDQTGVEEDKNFLEMHFAFNSVKDVTTPFVYRFVLNRNNLVKSGCLFEDVIGIISKDSTEIVPSDENSPDLIIRSRFDPKISVQNILKRRLRGVENIKKVYLVKNKENTNWSLHLSGLNFRGCLALGLDTYCNELHEVYAVLGVEATRAVIMKELRAVIEADGSYVNLRHLELLCDVMTLKGLRGITRHGINRASTGALKRCSFEQTVEILLDAAAAGETNRCKGVTENIMLGAMAPIGTGCTSLLLDVEALSERSRFLPGSPVETGPKKGMALSPLHYGSYSPQQKLSPIFVPNTPMYSPTSPIHSTASPRYSPLSPAYSVNSPVYIPKSPTYSPLSPSRGGAYSPTAPYQSAPYSPGFSPRTTPHSPSFTARTPGYTPENLNSEEHLNKRIKKE